MPIIPFAVTDKELELSEKPLNSLNVDPDQDHSVRGLRQAREHDVHPHSLPMDDLLPSTWTCFHLSPCKGKAQKIPLNIPSTRARPTGHTDGKGVCWGSGQLPEKPSEGLTWGTSSQSSP